MKTKIPPPPRNSISKKNSKLTGYCKHRHSYLEHPSCTPLEGRKPKILTFDLEVSPHVGEFWGRKWETNIIRPLSYGKILCYAASWGGSVFSSGQKSERKLVTELRDLFDEADVIAGHNIKAFDIKWCYAKFAYYKLRPPSLYRVFDTKTESKKYLNQPSYALNDLAHYFGLGSKMEHEGLALWTKCGEGDPIAWKKMLRYCEQDVRLTNKLIVLLYPFLQKGYKHMFVSKS